MSDNWHLKGTYFESCNCDLVCPCIFLMPPTHGDCKALVGWNIEQGHLDETNLDGVKVAVFLHAPSALTDGGWRISLYVDDQASEAQMNAITSLWSGDHGGHLAVIAGLVGEVVNVKQVPITFIEEGNKHHLKVGDIAENEMYEIDGQTEDSPVLVHNPPLAVAPGYNIHVNKAKKAWVKEDWITHEHSDTVGLSSPFNYDPDPVPSKEKLATYA